MLRTVVILSVVAFGIGSCAEIGARVKDDPCDNYHPLNRETRRYDFKDVHNIFNCDKTFAYYCSLDWKGPGWYRAVKPAGTMIAELEDGPDTDSCGTNNPLWLRSGTHASILPGTTGDAEACTSGYGDTCYRVEKLEIKNCGEYFVYNLPEVTSCLEGYCTM